MNEAQRQELIRRINPVIKKFAKDYDQSVSDVEAEFVYLIRKKYQEAAQAVQDWLSAHDSGPYAGR